MRSEHTGNTSQSFPARAPRRALASTLLAALAQLGRVRDQLQDLAADPSAGAALGPAVEGLTAAWYLEGTLCELASGLTGLPACDGTALLCAALGRLAHARQKDAPER